jgi:hypothetical protein
MTPVAFVLSTFNWVRYQRQGYFVGQLSHRSFVIAQFTAEAA